ncbi:hypothetical protein CAPTEDRAFT_162600 [Capitella teleta]|uniref:Transcription initiation factor TFIID subunit 12 n=1 Tax=Capitella teleta TaxID=283909 RepID=R7TC62_CAPTE|nr:hypothetical protein CAPTEDRAFT_162600 [Capitella teleta]|eukprot:ELT91102.1 hypothetical protein CAPTEDRAFT_162600 [Capitella teleta]
MQVMDPQLHTTTSVNHIAMATNAMPTMNSDNGPSAVMSAIKQEPEIQMAPSPHSNASPSTAQKMAARNAAGVATSVSENSLLDKRRLQELVKEVDPLEQLDEDVEEVMMQIADDFIDNVAMAACQLARHRKSNIVDVKDVQLHLERNWNMHIPGFGSEELKPYRKAASTEAHRQRMALIKKTLKKY